MIPFEARPNLLRLRTPFRPKGGGTKRVKFDLDLRVVVPWVPEEDYGEVIESINNLDHNTPALAPLRKKGHWVGDPAQWKRVVVKALHQKWPKTQDQGQELRVLTNKDNVTQVSYVDESGERETLYLGKFIRNSNDLSRPTIRSIKSSFDLKTRGDLGLSEGSPWKTYLESYKINLVATVSDAERHGNATSRRRAKTVRGRLYRQWCPSCKKTEAFRRH